jgi:hypothetical protein
MLIIRLPSPTPIQDEPRPYLACEGCHMIRPVGAEPCGCPALRTVCTAETRRQLIQFGWRDAGLRGVIVGGASEQLGLW